MMLTILLKEEKFILSKKFNWVRTSFCCCLTHTQLPAIDRYYIVTGAVCEGVKQ